MMVTHDKTEGPSTCLTILGIEVDSVTMELRLPNDKLERLSGLLALWRGRMAGNHRDLESLAGLLQHARHVVHQGHIFIRRIYAKTHHLKLHHFVRLNCECRADIERWYTFSRAWNGTSLLHPHCVTDPDEEVWSGGWGCGALWKGLWFQVAWDRLPIADAAIAGKEFYPIVLAAMVWGRTWCSSMVLFHCDNNSVVEVINRMTAKEPLLCHFS